MFYLSKTCIHIRIARRKSQSADFILDFFDCVHCEGMTTRPIYVRLWHNTTTWAKHFCSLFMAYVVCLNKLAMTITAGWQQTLDYPFTYIMQYMIWLYYHLIIFACLARRRTYILTYLSGASLSVFLSTSTTCVAPFFLLRYSLRLHALRSSTKPPPLDDVLCRFVYSCNVYSLYFLSTSVVDVFASVWMRRLPPTV